MLNNKIPIVASWLALSVIAWFSMMAASFGLQHDLTQAFDWWLLPVFAIPLAVFCTIKALRPAGKLPRIVRVIFWVITLAGAALIALLLWGQAEVLQYRRDIKMLAFAATLLALLVLWLGIRVRRVKMAGGAVFRWIPDCVIGGVCLVFILGGTRCAFARIYVPSLGRQAEARWAAIGRPMPEFERSLRVVEENDSLRKLTRDLQPFGVTSFYKWRWGQGDGKPDEIKVPEELTDFLEAVQDSKSDWIDLTVKNLPGFLNAHRSELDRLYQGILQRVPPVWGFVPKDGIWVRVPGYLSARKLSQIICADAIYRFEQGDTSAA